VRKRQPWRSISRSAISVTIPEGTRRGVRARDAANAAGLSPPEITGAIGESYEATFSLTLGLLDGPSSSRRNAVLLKWATLLPTSIASTAHS